MIFIIIIIAAVVTVEWSGVCRESFIVCSVHKFLKLQSKSHTAERAAEILYLLAELQQKRRRELSDVWLIVTCQWLSVASFACSLMKLATRLF